MAGLRAATGAAANTAPVDQAQQALQVALARAYPNVTRWQIEPEALPSDINGLVAISGSSVVKVTRLGARSAVWLGSADTGANRQGRLFWFSAAGYAPALVAVRTLAPNAPLDAADGAVEVRDIVGADCMSIATADLLPGLRTKRTLHAGEILCANLLEPMPAVVRGAEVNLLYRSPKFTLTARGIAQEDGLIGKPIAVRNASSGEIFTAIVSGRGEVSVND